MEEARRSVNQEELLAAQREGDAEEEEDVYAKEEEEDGEAEEEAEDEKEQGWAKSED